jgi:DNA polymerase-3 subunit epsilon
VVWALALSLCLLVLWCGAAVLFMTSTLEPAERDQVWHALVSRWMLGALWLLPTAWGLGVVWLHLFQRYVTSVSRLAENARAAVAADVHRPLVAAGSPELDSLAKTIQDLLTQRAALQADVSHQVAQASAHIEEERNRLAALMSELAHSVVVCNLDGRILLYNNRARMQFRALSAAASVTDGTELMGIGRSIHAVFDQRLVTHALENIRQRMAKGAAQPSAQFVTSTKSGQLLRVQMAPVRGLARQPGDQVLGGFVLMLENITRSFEEETRLDGVIHVLTERSRASLANTQAALEMLDFPDLAPPMRVRFLRVIRDEVARMGTHISELVQKTSTGMNTRWPLEDMLGADLLDAAQRRIAPTLKVQLVSAEVDAQLWLKVDSFSMLQVLTSLSSRLVDEFDIRFIQLRLAEHAGRAQLDLVWNGQAMSTETVMAWEMDPMRAGAETIPLSVRDVVTRHGGEMWFERDRIRHQAFFRFLLPLADAREAPVVVTPSAEGSRPEYYDFDLFQVSEQGKQLDECRLQDLVYTVFDTETTGLNPSHGDEIIQLGAARIVNQRLLSQECFDQLVNPRRPIPADTIPIHGITPEMVYGQPHIGEVLPAFHAFAQDTVLVAHNAAFDMRFLALKEQATGLRFDQPVLDTLLLSAAVHPHQPSHSLDAIADRLGIAVKGRHTALGDALVTAEVFLRLIPLLADQGIHTLGQAREAAQKTYYARLKY